MLKRGEALIVLVCFAAAMLVFCALVPMGAMLRYSWTVLILAGAVLLGAVPVHCAGSRRRKAKPERRQGWLWGVSFGMTAVSAGLAGAAAYIHLNKAVFFMQMLSSMLPGLGVLGVAALLMLWQPEHRKLVLLPAAAAAIALMVAQFLHPAGTLAALFGLMIALNGLLTLWLLAGEGGHPVMRAVSLGGFGAAILVGFAALAILSEGEALEGLEFGIDAPGGLGQQQAVSNGKRKP